MTALVDVGNYGHAAVSEARLELHGTLVTGRSRGAEMGISGQCGARSRRVLRLWRFVAVGGVDVRRDYRKLAKGTRRCPEKGRLGNAMVRPRGRYGFADDYAV